MEWVVCEVEFYIPVLFYMVRKSLVIKRRVKCCWRKVLLYRFRGVRVVFLLLKKRAHHIQKDFCLWFSVRHKYYKYNLLAYLSHDILYKYCSSSSAEYITFWVFQDCACDISLFFWFSSSLLSGDILSLQFLK